MAKPLSSKRNEGAGCMIVFFAFFLIIGSMVFFGTFVRPMQGVLQARNWTPTPCHIISSAVVTKDTGKNQKFYPDILYSYSFGGAQYDSTRQNPFSGNTNSFADAQRTVRQFPAGSNAQCYVNPANPTQALLDRSIPSSAWLGLLTLIFVAVGAGGIIWQFSSLRTEKTNPAQAQSSWQPPSVLLLGAGPNLVLKPVQSRTSKCFALALIALIWNAFIFFFFWKVVLEDDGAGFFRVFIGLFLIPFALIGLLILGAAFSSFLGLFNAALQLTLNRIDAAPGEELELSWQMQPGQFKPHDLRISLQAREEATYQRGTDTITEKNIFHKSEIVQTQNTAEIQNGRARVPIPENTMHSLDARSNKIIWSLQVRGSVRLWPDVDEEYLVFVVPQRSAASPA